MKFTFLSAVVAAALISGGSAGADAAENFYHDKTIRMLTAGGGSSYDAYARLVARHLPDHLEGGTTIIVQGMPGATIKVPLYLKNVVPNDSTVIGALNNAVAFAPLLGVPQADFDPTKFNWLGSPSTEVGLLVVWHEVPVNSIEDATKREVLLGVGSGGSSAAFFGRLLNTVFGTKLKLLSGYSGITSIYLAMERGEVEGVPAALWSDLQLTRPDWTTQKTQVKFLLQYGRNPIPELPDVPVAINLIKNDEDRRLFEVAMAPLEMGRPFTMAPEAAPEHVKLIRTAIMATFVDAAFVADAKKQRLDVDAVPKTGDDLLNIVTNVYIAPKSVRDRLAALFQADGVNR